MKILKNNSMKKILYLALLAGFFTNASHAQDSLNGLYFGASLGYGQTALPQPKQANVFERNGFTWHVLTGYQLFSQLGAEVGYTRMHNVTAKISSLAVKDVVEPWMIHLALKASLPIIDNFTLFGKAGGAYVYGKENLQAPGLTKVSSEAKTSPYLALGSDYQLNNNVIMEIGVSTTFKRGIVPRLTLGSIGINYMIYT